MNNSDEIAKIILSGSWGQFGATLIAICLSIVGVYVFSRIKKSAELSEISGNFNNLLDQQKKLVKQTEEIKSALNKESILFQIEATNYKQRSIDAIDEVYKSLILVRESAKEVAYAVGNSDICKDFFDSVSTFRRVLDQNKIWLPQTLAEKVEVLAIEIDSRCHKYILTSKSLNAPVYRTPEEVGKMCDIQDQFYDYILKETRLIFAVLINDIESEYNPKA